MNKNYRQYAAECAGTFVLVFVGVGTVIMSTVAAQSVGVVAIAFAFGISIMAAVYMFAPISGAHINPAVTIGFLALRKIKLKKAVWYIISQLAGATLASVALMGVFASSHDFIANGVTTLGLNIHPLQGILAETLFTFFLMMIVLAFVGGKEEHVFHGALAIGLVITMDIMLGAVLTGASMNPARTFGPALVSGAWSNHLVYWLGPVTGALLAAPLYRYLYTDKSKEM